MWWPRAAAHAEDLHREFESLGIEAISRRRLQTALERSGPATRVGPLTYRDDRKTNEFFVAEIFEIKNFLKPDSKPGWYKLESADSLLSGLLKMPGSATRLAPFALPHPCDATHTFEVYCVALAPGVAPEKTIDNPWIQFTSTRRMLAGNWIIQSALWTLTDSVPPEGIEEYRDSVQQIRGQSAWTLLVPAGVERPHQRSDFGTLPTGWESVGAAKRNPMTASQDLEPESGGHRTAAGASSDRPVEIRYRRRKRHRRRRHAKKSTLIWGVCLAGTMLVLLVFLIIALVRGTEHMRPGQAPGVTTGPAPEPEAAPPPARLPEELPPPQ